MKIKNGIRTFTTNKQTRYLAHKINEIIDNLGGGGTATDVQINGTSITSNNVANIVTNTAYNASSNKIATMSDLPSVANMQTTTNLVTSVSSQSTDSQYPSAKLFYDTVGNIESLLSQV